MNKVNRSEVCRKVDDSGFESLTGPELKSYSKLGVCFSKPGAYEEETSKLLSWAKRVQDTQTLFETKTEFVKTVNRILRKYKKAEIQRRAYAAADESLRRDESLGVVPVAIQS